MGSTGRPLIVVSNTSPLTNLAVIRQFDLLEKLFGNLHICPAVVTELSSGGYAWPGAGEVQRARWIEVQPVIDRHIVDALRLGLDVGEAETIALALQIQADLVLMDEQDGRRAAQHLGLSVMGVVGLLVRAKQSRLVAAVQPLLELLREQAGFYIGQTLYDHAMNLAGER